MRKRQERIKKLARHLVSLSLEDGRVSQERVEAVLSWTAEQPLQRAKPLLKLYLNYIRQEIRRTEADVEHAGAIDEASINELANSLSAIYERPVTVSARNNNELLAGIRVRIGDDVWDHSASGMLATFQDTHS